MIHRLRTFNQVWPWKFGGCIFLTFCLEKGNTRVSLHKDLISVQLQLFQPHDCKSSVRPNLSRFVCDALGSTQSSRLEGHFRPKELRSSRRPRLATSFSWWLPWQVNGYFPCILPRTCTFSAAEWSGSTPVRAEEPGREDRKFCFSRLTQSLCCWCIGCRGHFVVNSGLACFPFP